MNAIVIAVAQISSARGDVDRNTETHASAVRRAAEQGIHLIVFPELSLTGYEPDLAAGLAFGPADSRLEPLSELAQQYEMTIVAGAPLTNTPRPHLGAFVISQAGDASTYSKIFLHGSEEQFFSPGEQPKLFRVREQSIGAAICADITHAEHPAMYADLNANVYAAGVHITEAGYDKDTTLMQAYARRHGMLTVMANYNGSSGGMKSAGKSVIWSPEGMLLAQAPSDGNALVIASIEGGEWTGRVLEI